MEDGTATSVPVANEAACGEGFCDVRRGAGDGGAPGARDSIRLCPNTCARLRAEPTAVVQFTFECPPG